MQEDQTHIRSAASGDIPKLLEFEQGIIEAERPFIDDLKETGVKYYDIERLIEDENTLLLVAEMDTGLVGCGYARIEESLSYLKRDFHAYLGFMFVDPNHRNKGINKKILDELIAWCRSKNVFEIILEVYDGNDPAINAYKKAGFTNHTIKMRLNLKELPDLE